MQVRLRVGLYPVFLEDWRKVYSPEQIFVTRLEDYTTNRSQVLSQIADFLDLGQQHA